MSFRRPVDDLVLIPADPWLCRTLDFEVHRKVLQDEMGVGSIQHSSFDLCIGQKASRLANGFLNLFLCRQQGNGATPDLEPLNRTKDSLINIFKQALRLAVQLSLSPQVFEYRMYAAGTTFDSIWMHPYVESQSKGPHQPHVKVTLLPAIRMRKEDRMRVDYCGQISYESGAPGDCWSKAFVVLDE